MLEQVTQAAQAATSGGIKILDAGVAILIFKAAAELSFKGIKAMQERSRAKSLEAKADIEQARTLGIAMLKDKDGARSAVVAFCPSHLDCEKRLATNENEVKHINADLAEIKADVKVIRSIVGNGR